MTEGSRHSSLIGYGLLMLVLGSSTYLYFNINRIMQLFADKTYMTFFIGPKDWEVQIVDRSGGLINEDTKKDIYQLSTKFLKRTGTSDLGGLVRAIEGLGALERISLVRTRPQSLVISISQRKPLMLVSVANKIRNLTQEAVVYGDVQSIDSSGKPTVTIFGIFEGRTTPFTLDSTQRLLTTKEEDDRLLDAIEIHRIFTKNAIELRTMSFQTFRGFTAVLTDGTEIMLGSRPFEYKLEKLSSILSKLKAQGIAAARIELDYDGKAFIKEKRM